MKERDLMIVGRPPRSLQGPLSRVARRLHPAIQHAWPEPEWRDSRFTCARSSLVLQDALRAYGIDAVATSVYLEITGPCPERGERYLTIGHPDDTTHTPGYWNGHAVVVTNGYLIDPTLYQAERPWHRFGRMLALPLLRNREPLILMRRTLAAHRRDRATIRWIAYPDNPYWPAAVDAVDQDRQRLALTTLARFIGAERSNLTA